MCLTFLQKPRREENKVEFLERQFHGKKRSCVHKEETEYCFELSLSIYVFLKCKT